jgi:succinate dehydrogenase flavin-adding protein (antitoxin of CptAB toxin-antitoxin module)
MKINRMLSHFFTTEIRDEEIAKKYEKSFEEILQEEQEKLMRLISEADETVNMKQLYSKYNPRMTGNSFFGE